MILIDYSYAWKPSTTYTSSVNGTMWTSTGTALTSACGNWLYDCGPTTVTDADAIIDEIMKKIEKDKEKEAVKEENKNEGVSFDVERIEFVRRMTTVFWADGTQTTVRCARDTEFSEYAAFTAALAKKIYGNNSTVNRIIRQRDMRRIRAEEKKKNLEEQAERERIAAKKRKKRVKRMAKELREKAEAEELAKKMGGRANA